MITNNSLVPGFVLESFKFCDVYGSFFLKKLSELLPVLSPQPRTRARGRQKANA